MSEKKKVGLDIARSSTLVQEYQVASWERNELPTTPELTAIDEKIAKDPENAELHKERGLLLAGLGYYREAAECYSRAIAINPFNWEYYRHRAHRFVSCGYFADGAGGLHHRVPPESERLERVVSPGLELLPAGHV